MCKEEEKMNKCIEVHQLTKTYDGRKVVDNLTFEVEKGEVYGQKKRKFF